MICYRLASDEVQIVAVLDCRQDPIAISRRLGNDQTDEQENARIVREIVERRAGENPAE